MKVIGVKYVSPAKETGGKPSIKVKSFVSDEFKELVDLAALHWDLQVFFLTIVDVLWVYLENWISSGSVILFETSFSYLAPRNASFAAIS